MTGSRIYRLYGLTLRSSLPLPCPAVGRRGSADVHFLPRSRRRTTPWPGGRNWFQYHRLEDGGVFLRWAGLFEFLVRADGRRIEWHRHPGASDESLYDYLLAQVLSFSLLAFDREPLHASAVTVDGKTIAFLGDCGAGKSTLAAAFLRAGSRLVTDDLLTLDPRPRGMMAHPGLPRIKLFPRVARAVLGVGPEGAPRLNPGTRKLILPVAREAHVQRSVPLDALYVLSSSRAPRVRSLAWSEALLDVVRSAFNLIVTDRPRLERQFAFAQRVVASVPVRSVRYARRLEELPRVMDTIRADLDAACGRCGGREPHHDGCRSRHLHWVVEQAGERPGRLERG